MMRAPDGFYCATCNKVIHTPASWPAHLRAAVDHLREVHGIVVSFGKAA